MSDKGALYHEYDWNVHCFIGHLRRVRSSTVEAQMEVTLEGKKQTVTVKAADPLALPGYPLYYMHSKIPLYNHFFFQLYDACFATTLAIVCPWLTVTTEASMEKLFDLRFDGDDIPVLSPKLLHILDRTFWMLPFARKTDLEDARKTAGVPVERHTGFLDMMLKEHEHPDARKQLKKAWTDWIRKNYVEDEPTSAAAADSAPGQRVPTPVQDGDGDGE